MASSSQTAIPQAEPASASISLHSSSVKRAQRQSKALEKKDVLSAAVSASAARSTRAKSQSTADVIPSTNGTNAEESTAVQKVIDPNNPAPWKHPDELPYIRREDWSQDLMLEYLIQKSFSIPPRDNASNPFVDILPKEAPPVTIPRKYRVPLMFLAKFQWESLRLVLNASDPKTEWHEFKFDIIHITRLCQHLFNQAKEAKERGGPKGLDKMWRSPMFDRVLTRFYHHWFISRDWFLKHFYEEFEEEEYQNDILRNDWARWALKGHKGFRLTKNEIQNGITAEQFMRGLGRNADGVWTWTTDPTISESSITTAAISNEPASPPASENMDTITNVTPANNSVEVKREHMEAAAVNLPKQSSYHAGEAVTSIPTPPPTSNPSSPPIAQAAAASKNVPNFTPPTQVTSAPAAPFPDTSDTSSRPPPQTVTPIAMAVPSISAGVSIIAPVPATGTVNKALNSESNTVSDIAQSAHLSIHASQNATATAVSDKAAPETDKVTEPTTNPLQPAAMSKENITISNNQVPADTSTQLAGTKRAHDDVDSPITASPSRKKNQAHARRSLAEAYRYGQLTSAKLSGPQKSSTKTVKSSVADAATEGSTEGSSASEKLSIKLKRATTSATVPPLKKRKRASGRPDSNVDSSISVALSKRSRAHSSKKRSQRSSAVRILSGALVTSGTDDEESASVAKSDGPSKLPASAMSSLTSNHLTSSTPNVSSAAFLIPANPKQTILSYLNGSAPQRLAASPIIPAVNPFDSTTEVSKKAVDNPTTNGGIANNVPAPKSLTPKPLTHQPSIAKEATPTASGRSQIVSKASESIIAHGLLDVSRQSPAPKDRSEGAVPFTTSVAQSQTAATVLDEKSPPKSKSPDNAALPINGATHESQGKVAASLAGPGTNDDAPAAKSVQTTQRSTVASPILPTYTSIASLIGKALPESQVNAGNEKNKEERMVVDVEAELKSPSNLSRDRSLAAEQSVGLLMAQDTRAKSLHTILLLRDLLEFLCSRTQTSTSPHSPSEPDLHNLLDSRTRRTILNEEEAITIDHRLDVLAHASVALAKVLYPYRGAELERRIIALDKRLQQQFDMVWTREQQLAAAQQLRARTLPDKEVQTSSLAISRGVQTLAEADTTYGSSSSTSSVYVTQAVQTSGVPEDRSVLDSGTQTEDIQPLPPLTSTERKSTPLSTDVTMVDLPTNAPVGKHDSEMDKSAPTSSVSRRSEPVAKIMMAIMRNMADLFECSTREDGITSPKSEKGKEREVDTSDMRMQVFDGFGDSPIVSTIMNEFKTMKDEMRITDWVREEMRSMSSLHATQVNSLQEEVKKGKQELEETKRRYQAQIDNLNVALQMAKKGKGRLEMLDDEERAQAAELHELKRRISSLESRNRYSGTGGDSISAASRGSPAPPTPTDLVPARWGSHSLSHLPGQDSRNAPSPSPVAYGREHPSKPGTPVSGAGPLYGRSVDRADSEEAVPLPAKSQRKKNVFYFPRGPV